MFNIVYLGPVTLGLVILQHQQCPASLLLSTMHFDIQSWFWANPFSQPERFLSAAPNLETGSLCSPS